MPIYAPECTDENVRVKDPVMVIEQTPLLQDEHGQGIDRALGHIVSTMSSGGQLTVLGLVVVEPQPKRALPGGLFVSGGSATWGDMAEALFGDSRYMTPDEQAEFNEISRSMVKPLSKPLKRFPA